MPTSSPLLLNAAPPESPEHGPFMPFKYVSNPYNQEYLILDLPT